MYYAYLILGIFAKQFYIYLLRRKLVVNIAKGILNGALKI